MAIHGTKDPPCQVGNSPVEVYREANPAKHLVVVAGANHFGYTDDICLEPAEELCPDHPRDPGWDSSSEVGGVEGQEAHARQQLAAGNYLQAFFSKYLQGHDDALDYIAGERCELPPGDPPNWEAADSQPVRLFEDLEDLNVQVWVFSCLE